MSAFEIIHGDALAVLRTFPDESVHCCVTSPPYYGLRDYGTAKWEGGDPECDHSNTRRGHGDEKQATQAGSSRDKVGRDCRYCGATRVDAQIGLERTPAEYIARLVEVFREVRRVLKPDGTCWVNIGDSYNGYMANQRGTGLETKRQQARKYIEPGAGLRTKEVKNKDLVGIPWMLAFALREPYYAGRIKREQDRIWLAAMMDGEGCFYIHRRKAGQHAGDGYYRQNDSFAPAFEVANTSERIIDRCIEIAGCGSIIRQEKDRRQPLYRWTVRCDEARQLARELYPYLVAKQQQARIVYGLPTSEDRASAGWGALKSLHAGIVSDVDFPEPPSCYEPGFYLRQDCIWSKPNPMPESVKDRCTKAHEYVFLLTKSAKYFYDAEAIKERAAWPDGPNSPESIVSPYGQGFTRANGPVSHRGSQFHTGKTGAHQLGRASSKVRIHGNLPGRDDNGAACNKPGQEYRNKRSVWTLATLPTPEAHFATFPLELPEICIRAGCPEGGVVLDPFSGAGTTGLACLKNGRRFVGIELNAEYIEIAHKRARKYYPLLVGVA